MKGFHQKILLQIKANESYVGLSDGTIHGHGSLPSTCDAECILHIYLKEVLFVMSCKMRWRFIHHYESSTTMR